MDGRRIPDRNSDSEGYIAKLEKAINFTLKEEGGKGLSYTDEERKLMIWYVYRFLNRSKPSTHILALAGMEENSFRERLPFSLRRLVEKTKRKF